MLNLHLSDGTPRFFRHGKEVHLDIARSEIKCEPPIYKRKDADTTAPKSSASDPSELFFPTRDIDGSPLNPGQNGLWARMPSDSYLSASYKFFSWDELPRDICEKFGH